MRSLKTYSTFMVLYLLKAYHEKIILPIACFNAALFK